MYIKAKENRLSSLLKYPGGKERELPIILGNLPSNADNYYEPFVGGGAVFFALDSDHYFINDKSSELIDFYISIKNQNKSFFSYLERLEHYWFLVSDLVKNHFEEIFGIYSKYKKNLDLQKLEDEVSSFVFRNADNFNGLFLTDFNVGITNFVNELIKNISGKIARVVKLEDLKGFLIPEDFYLNIECSFKSAFYMHFRYLYNYAETLKIDKSFYSAIYFFIREYCYSSMFRYNKNNKFNVPFGGISYNNKSMMKKIDYFYSQNLKDHFSRTTICCDDFKDFLDKYKPGSNDFMFLDPPYDTEFSTYAQNEFSKQDQIRLADYLKTECDCYFLLIIKNNPFISSLYPSHLKIKGNRVLSVDSFEKKYMVSFQNRNDKEVEHLLIKNY